MENIDYFLKDIKNIKGVKEVTASKLNKLNIYRIIDLLLHMPILLNKKNYCSNILEAKVGDLIIIPLKAVNYQHALPYKKYFKVTALDSNDIPVNINYFHFFNIDYIKKQLPIGETKLIIGKLEFSNNTYQINHPEDIKNTETIASINLLDRVYPLTLGISQKFLRGLILRELNNLPVLDEWLPSELITKYNLPPFKESLENIHLSNNFTIDPQNKYLKRLFFDEVYNYFLNIKDLKKEKNIGISFNAKSNALAKILNTNLPFLLTIDQKNAIKAIYKDMGKKEQMIRLLQGDVGSGKTVVAFFSALKAIENGYQVAFMAPTESLARQHFLNLDKYKDLLNIKVSYLSSALKAKEKKETIAKLKNKEIDVLIGTHALFQKDIIFNKLGLIIIDEQHKFGVEQRANLIEKGENPDILLTTATPIPRTLVLSYYGDIDLSEIKEKPQNQKPIITKLISQKRLKEVLEYLEKALINDKKVFWVCPLVDESEKLPFISSTERFEVLKKCFPNKEIFLVHGKLKPEEKNRIIDEFTKAKAAILVATTVIEVGIDIKDSNIIIIEHSNHYGLSQLHQLRGRVGRGDEDAVAILLYDDKISETAKKRLMVIKNSLDGFYIAEQDYLTRGSGNVIGFKQSGLVDFKIASLDCLPPEDLKKIILLTKTSEITDNNKYILHNIFTSKKAENLFLVH